MRRPPAKPYRGWGRKFADAFRGLWFGIAGQSSFAVHFAVAAVVVAVGLWFRVALWEWCVLVLAITSVLTTELLNSALEWLVPAVTEDYDPHIRTALDVASAAVFTAALGAAAVGAIVFVPHVLALWD